MRRSLLLAAAAAALGTGACESSPPPAEATEPVALVEPEQEAEAEQRPDSPARKRIPNYTFTTHEGERVRLYDDLVRGKFVIINFMYTNCDGI